MKAVEMKQPPVGDVVEGWWKRRAAWAVALVLALLAAGGFVIARQNADTPPPDPVATVDDVYERVAAALVAYDPVEYPGLTPADFTGVLQPQMMGWQIEFLRFDPTFSGCSGSKSVACQVEYGEEYFYSVVLGHNLAGTMSVRVDDGGTFTFTTWPFPQEVKDIEEDLRTWVRVAHPELESRMFGNDAYGVFKFSEEALRLHAQYLDEYLTHLRS
ncbi:MAG: hypothetical protein HKN80_09390 [Acidimicrobiia bacterium]|nr:hypothetical protein [Acidimicrobiia bacterium]